MYTVSYIRGIFPQNCFADKKYQNICVKTLRPETPDCIRLLKWLENGVFDALAKKYLDEAIFMIQGVEDESSLCEICFDRVMLILYYPTS